eukprot:scaffold285908_cov26-Tisochrysis_lutea.AAC.1
MRLLQAQGCRRPRSRAPPAQPPQCGHTGLAAVPPLQSLRGMKGPPVGSSGRIHRVPPRSAGYGLDWRTAHPAAADFLAMCRAS